MSLDNILKNKIHQASFATIENQKLYKAPHIQEQGRNIYFFSNQYLAIIAKTQINEVIAICYMIIFLNSLFHYHKTKNKIEFKNKNTIATKSNILFTTILNWIPITIITQQTKQKQNATKYKLWFSNDYSY